MSAATDITPCPHGYRILLLSDIHFYTPCYYKSLPLQGAPPLPSRLPTDQIMNDPKSNPFQGLIQLVRDGAVAADAIIVSGDLTTCADITALNMAWLQLNRLSVAMHSAPVLATAGNHDIDSRFQASRSSPERLLRNLDPPFPVSDPALTASYWANGYCVVDHKGARLVLVNSCSLHGFNSPQEQHNDHGEVSEELLRKLKDDLAHRSNAWLNILVCHHHPIEVNPAPRDYSTIKNGLELITTLSNISPPRWLVLHGHRHLPSVHYADASPNSPVVFTAGSFAASLHLELQGRTANQFYVLTIAPLAHSSSWGGTYEAWTWADEEGWLTKCGTRALAPTGGFGYRNDPSEVANAIAPWVPAHNEGAIRWKELESRITTLRYMIASDKQAVLERLSTLHGIHCETDQGRVDHNSDQWRIGRTSVR